MEFSISSFSWVSEIRFLGSLNFRSMKLITKRSLRDFRQVVFDIDIALFNEEDRRIDQERNENGEGHHVQFVRDFHVVQPSKATSWLRWSHKNRIAD